MDEECKDIVFSSWGTLGDRVSIKAVAKRLKVCARKTGEWALGSLVD